MSEHLTNLLPINPEKIEYREIHGFPGYRVGSDGSVWSCRPRNGKGPLLLKWRPMKAIKHLDGYLFVMLGKKTVPKTIHSLVLEAFIGIRPTGKVCRHLDGNRSNNRLKNLCWGTNSENAQDQIRHGTMARGERSGVARLKDVDIPIIRQLSSSGISQDKIAKMFGVSQPTIGRILRGECWAHIVS